MCHKTTGEKGSVKILVYNFIDFSREGEQKKCYQLLLTHQQINFVTRKELFHKFEQKMIVLHDTVSFISSLLSGSFFSNINNKAWER